MNTQTEELSFIDEMLLEDREAEMAKRHFYYDYTARQIGEYQDEIAKINKQVESEITLINEWATRKKLKFERQISDLESQLEEFIKEMGEKTIDLPSVTLKMRKKPDRVEVSSLEDFLASAREEMLTIIPEQIKPNLTSIKKFVQMSPHKTIPGVTLIKGEDTFSYKIKPQDKEESNDSETKA